METELVKSEKELDKSGNNSQKQSDSPSKLAVWWKETVQYLREVWVEVRLKNGRVSWPTFDSVRITTRVVIISSIGLGLFIGLCDALFQYIYNVITNSIG